MAATRCLSNVTHAAGRSHGRVEIGGLRAEKFPLSPMSNASDLASVAVILFVEEDPPA